jgi:hypothetical protein
VRLGGGERKEFKSRHVRLDLRVGGIQKEKIYIGR